MTAITVLNKANVPTGPFTREQVAQKLQSGEFSLEDLAFIEGLSQWTPLRDVLAKVDGPVAPVAPAAYVSPAAPSTTPPAYSYAATMQPPTHLVYGGFWLRVAAYLIDALILIVPVMIISIPVFLVLGGLTALTTAAHQPGQSMIANHQTNSALPPAMFLTIMVFELLFVVAVTVVGWLYYAYMESGPHQATIGKRVIGLKVTDMTGERITFGRASGRYFGKIITGLVPFAIGYIMAGFTERKQALHDFIAGTLVVRK